MVEEMFEGSLRLLLGTDATVLFLPAGSERKKKKIVFLKQLWVREREEEEEEEAAFLFVLS